MSVTTLAGLDFAGRHFSAADLQLIAEVTRDFYTLALTELSKTLAELLEWKRPTGGTSRSRGGLKYEECRALLEYLQAEGRVTLPTLRKTSPRGSTPHSHHLRGRSPDPLDPASAGLPAAVLANCDGIFDQLPV